MCLRLSVLIACSLQFVSAENFVIPWAAEQENVYTSILVINNHANVPLDLLITAVQVNGASNTQSLTIDAFGSYRQPDLVELFGLSKGVSLHITTSHDKTSIGILTTSLRGSGTSPAQGDAVPLSMASSTLAFPYMPEGVNGSLSAVVVTNTSSDTSANVTFMLDHNPEKTFSVSVLPTAPYANMISLMFDLDDDLNEGDHLITVTSDGPKLIGANFVFNQEFEPSLANAVATNVDIPNTDPDCFEQLTQLENEIKTDLNSYTADTDFTLLIKSESSRSFLHSTGTSDENKIYKSASTSKWVAAAVILSLVKDGFLSLDDHPQDFLDSWPATGNLSEIKLRHLLTFTSGLVNEPFCLNLPGFDFESCVEEIATLNMEAKTPGEEFYYASTHLQVAGLMAVRASGLPSWQHVFEQFKSETGLFTSSNFDLPSAQNPRLAGGMHWNAAEYFDFLEALYRKRILTTELLDLMLSDQFNGAEVVYSPSLSGINEDWHYGFGAWIECHSSSFDCNEVTRVSSPGAYGAYPFIDFEHQYYGIIARQGVLGTYVKGYELFEFISKKLETWASINCN